MCPPLLNKICLTPVRNEAWVLPRFLSCAETWADVIVVLDQGSTDGSLDIARRHPKVHLVQYPHSTYDDDIRRETLIASARSIVPGPRLLVALDADEIMACDAWDHAEMKAFLASPPGTLGRMRWINVLPDEPRAWIPPARTDFMFLDDGTEFHGAPMHGPRLPVVPVSQTMDLTGPKVIHLQYTDWQRMRAKQRWYQAQERIEHPRKRPIQIYRQYHHMDVIDPAERHDLSETWFRDYVTGRSGDLFKVEVDDVYASDGRVMDLFEEHGSEKFRRLDLWDGGWQRRAEALDRSVPAGLAADPHSAFERAVFRWLERTQARALDPRVRWTQRALRMAGW